VFAVGEHQLTVELTDQPQGVTLIGTLVPEARAGGLALSEFGGTVRHPLVWASGR
jgi:hypothetical protein